MRKRHASQYANFGSLLAYIEGAMADSYSFSGTWYNSWREYQDNIHGQPFRMRRQ